MISAADFEDIFGWGPARARTGLPVPTPQLEPPAVMAAAEDAARLVEQPALVFAMREVGSLVAAQTRELAGTAA